MPFIVNISYGGQLTIQVDESNTALYHTWDSLTRVLYRKNKELSKHLNILMLHFNNLLSTHAHSSHQASAGKHSELVGKTQCVTTGSQRQTAAGPRSFTPGRNHGETSPSTEELRPTAQARDEQGPEGLLWAPEGLGWAPEGLGWAPEGLLWAPEGLGWAPEGLGWAPEGLLWAPEGLGSRGSALCSRGSALCSRGSALCSRGAGLQRVCSVLQRAWLSTICPRWAPAKPKTPFTVSKLKHTLAAK